MTAVDGETCAVVATAADIICSLRGADLAGWTPPWRNHDQPARKELEAGGGGGDDERELAWPAVARGKRLRSSRRGESPSASGSAASVDAKEKKLKKKEARRGARGSPASPLDYSGGSGSGSGSGASTSGGEDGAFCSSQPEPPPAAFPPAAATAAFQQQLAAPAAPAPPAPSKVGGLAGRRTILPVPPPRLAGQRARKKMRLPEIQQMVRSLSVENDALRKEMKALQRACTALSQENGKLETRIDQSISMENKGKKPQPHTAEQEAPNGFVLPDLNLPADV